MFSRPVHLCFLFSLLVLMLCCGPTEGGSGDHLGRNGSPEKGDKRVLFVVFDPTIYMGEVSAAGAGPSTLSNFIKKFEEFFTDLPENSAFVLSFVQPRSAYPDSPIVLNFPFHTEFDGVALHRETLHENFDKIVKPRIIETWKSAHGEKNIKTLSSCLFHSLFFAGRSTDNYGCSDGSTACQLILVSDMLEACSWDDRGVNFEERLDELSELTYSDVDIELDNFFNIYIVEISNPRIDAISDRIKVQDFWMRSLKTFGARDIKYSNDFP